MFGPFMVTQAESSKSICLATAICAGSVSPSAYFSFRLLQRVVAAVSNPFGSRVRIVVISWSRVPVGVISNELPRGAASLLPAGLSEQATANRRRSGVTSIAKRVFMA